MEKRIASLKILMQKEREERERLGGVRWKSSKEPTDVKDAKSVMPKGEKPNNKPKGQMKFKVLSDKPLENYSRKTKSKEIFTNGSSLCGQCDKVRAKLDCMECGENYCPPCFKQFHAKGAMRKHTWKTIDQERLPTSRILSHREPNNASCSSNISPNQIEAQFTQQPVSSTTSDAPEQGGLLLEGTYDEEASAKSFQDALKEWRGAPSPAAPKQKKDLWVNPAEEELPKETRSCATEPDVVSESCETDANSTSDVKINFNPTMSYADRLLLKKHRKDPVPAKNGPTKQSSSKKYKPTGKKISKPDASQAPTASNAHLNACAPSQRQYGLATQQPSSSGNQSRAISIQLIASDDDEIKYATSPDDGEGSSPIVNEAPNESPRGRNDRFTLSQMGRLKIVELSFSDPENENKSPDRSNSVSSNISVASTSRRTTSGLKSAAIETPQPLKQGLTPHPPSTPSSIYVARQKILLNKNKKPQQPAEASALKSTRGNKNSASRKWKPSTEYVGLDSFFTAGVEKENKTNINRKSGDSKVLKNIHDVNNCPKITIGVKGSWRPDSSWSNASETVDDDRSKSSPEKENKKNRKSTTTTKRLLKQDSQTNASGNGVDRLTARSGKASESTDTDTATPRGSLADFDFLSAMPPISKGDDFNKIHRASTATLFPLSPQPPDIWNEDSECELMHSPKLKKASLQHTDDISIENNNSNNQGITSSESDDDERALEALTNEMADRNKGLEESSKNGMTRDDDMQRRLEQWEEDSLSIEDDDAGSGLTSSADGDTSRYDGDDFSDNEFYNCKTQVENLK
eukprot:gene11215-12392_t